MEKIKQALEHVQDKFPEVTSVTYAQEDEQCGGFWRYHDMNGKAPVFSNEDVNVTLLEEALDQAWEVLTFPATLHLKDAT